MSFIEDPREWAEATFGSCDLGDQRRTARLVDYAARQAAEPGVATNALFKGDPAGAEGAYRFLRNKAIQASAMDEGYWATVAEAAVDRELVLAIQDTTTLRFDHRAAQELGHIGGAKGTKARGYVVHSTLAVDGLTGEPLGLLDQERRLRPEQRAGRNSRKQRPYEDKESFKWESASRRFRSLLQGTDNVIEVCDREADVFEYLEYEQRIQGRYVVRACYDRRLILDGDVHLREYVYSQPVLGYRKVEVTQRGPLRGSKHHGSRAGRKKRTAAVEVRSARVAIWPGDRHKKQGREPLETNVVSVREANPPAGESPIEWILLTSEPVDDFELANRVVDIYARRWLIEEFHKAWKTGCRVEKRALDAENLPRMIVILGAVAVRLLQLRSSAERANDSPATAVLTEDQLSCLLALQRKSKRSVPRRPTSRWALTAIAKLGGWRDTQRTGRIGWESLWKGWSHLEILAAGWALRRTVR